MGTARENVLQRQFEDLARRTSLLYKAIAIMIFAMLAMFIFILAGHTAGTQLKQENARLKAELTTIKRDTLEFRVVALGVKALQGKATQAEIDAMQQEVEAEKKRVDSENDPHIH